MTAYEAAVQEKDQLYARIQLVREEIKQEQDPGRRGEQKHRLRILFEMYHESLERLEALRPPQEKRHKAVKRTVIHTGAAGADVNSFDFFERCDLTFADLEGNQVRWDDLGSDNGESRARLMRALRRGRPQPCPLHRRQRRGAAGRGRARAGAVCALPAARGGRSDPGAGQSCSAQGDRLRSPKAAGADAGSRADSGADMGPAKAPCGGAEPSPACVGRRGGSAYRLAPRASTRASAGLPRENNKSRLTIRRGRALQLSHGHSERSRTQEAAPAEQPTSVQRTPVFNPRLPIPSSRDFVSAG